MISNFQDDSREEYMRQLFDMYKIEADGRSGTDAILDYNGNKIQFELKTTSTGSVTTVRDFGIDHIKKWKNKHWLIGFFINGEEYYKYGSPDMMQSWISEKELYIKPDCILTDIIHTKLELNDVYLMLGVKDKYSIDDAKSIHKKQYSKKQYIELQDLDGGYSADRILDILKDRTKYIMSRGCTLNNPHISFNYFDDWVTISSNHATELRNVITV